MQDNFDLTGYLRKNNKLLNENIGGYVDLKPVKEEEEDLGGWDGDGVNDQYDGEYDDQFGPAEVDELEKPEKIYADDEAELDYTDRMMDLGGASIEKGITDLIDDGFEPEDVLDMCKMFIDAHAGAKAQGKQF
jgi:hypothetical protein